MEIELDEDNQILLIDANDFTAASAFTLFDRIVALDPERRCNILIDRSSPTTDTLQWSEIRVAGEVNPDRLKEVFSGRMIAGVVEGGVRFAAARQIAAVAASLDIAEYRPFTSRCEALAWLLGDETMPG